MRWINSIPESSTPPVGGPRTFWREFRIPVSTYREAAWRPAPDLITMYGVTESKVWLLRAKGGKIYICSLDRSVHCGRMPWFKINKTPENKAVTCGYVRSFRLSDFSRHPIGSICAGQRLDCWYKPGLGHHRLVGGGRPYFALRRPTPLLGLRDGRGGVGVSTTILGALTTPPRRLAFHPIAVGRITRCTPGPKLK